MTQIKQKVGGTDGRILNGLQLRILKPGWFTKFFKVHYFCCL